MRPWLRARGHAGQAYQTPSLTTGITDSATAQSPAPCSTRTANGSSPNASVSVATGRKPGSRSPAPRATQNPGVEPRRAVRRWLVMPCPTDDLMIHARKTLLRARYLPRGPMKFWLRHIGGIYHLLAKQGAGAKIAFLDDARAARAAKARSVRPTGAPTGTWPPR